MSVTYCTTLRIIIELFSGNSDQLRNLGLWYDATGDWNTAHEIVQRLDNAAAARIHAYLHRKQGDDWNSRYWHRQAGTSYAEHMNLQQEWESLVIMIVE